MSAISVNKLVSSIILGGSIAAAGAILVTSPAKKPETQVVAMTVDAKQPVREEPTSTDAGVNKEVTVADENGEVVEVAPAKIEVAIAHGDKESDFEALAKDALEAGDYKLAFENLRKHIFDHAPTSEVLLNIGRTGREVGEYGIAEQALRDAVALDATNADAELELARVLVDEDELADARTHAKRAIHLDGENALAWNVAGRIAMLESSWQRAEVALRKALEIEPTNGMIHNNMGLLYIYTAKPQNAVESLETAVELFGDDTPSFVYNNLGLAHEMAKEYDEARDAFEEALVANPTYARARVNLSRVLTTLANVEEAKKFETAKGIDPKEAADLQDSAGSL
jgi:Tfp pilus assembly protein PilF